MASNSTVAHRFANKDYNFERGLKGSSTHISGNDYYSYSTVFGQWVDRKLCIIYNGGTSITSSKHKLGSWNFPKDVVLLPYDDRWNGRGSYYYGGYYHGCDLLGYSKEFTYEHRVELIDYYVHEIYTALNAIVDGKSKGLEEHAESIISEYWGYVMKLCSLYRDTTINKWLRKKRVDLDGEWELKKRLVKELDAQNMDVKSLVDIVFGEGTWKRYYDYCARYRKQADKREKMEKLCKRLGIRSPYEEWGGYNVLDHEMSADDIRNLTAKERLDLHFKALAYKEWKDGEDARNNKYNRNNRNAYKWIVGVEPKKKSWGVGYEKNVDNNCINKDNGVVYECSGKHIFGFYWCDTDVSFDYDSFRKSEDKEQWIADFYAKCKEVADNRKALAQVEQEQIDECLSRGIEGKRDLWRKHLQGLYDIYDKDDEFYMGGNVLLRLNLNKDKVETSKNIRIPVDVCKKMWKLVSKWHENPSSFKQMTIKTLNGTYTISSYHNDILTAGCHDIAFVEMERMYNEIINA